MERGEGRGELSSAGLAAALRAVDRDHFCLDGHGRPLPQTSAPEMIARMLALLDVQPGHHVLEVGTGSGYSSALLAELAGPAGQVISLDIDPEMTQRAARLLAAADYANVLLITADGRDGSTEHAPFDRIVSWGSVGEVPAAWREQARPGAVLVVPMRAEEQAWVNRYSITQHNTLIEDERIPGSFIPLTVTPLRPWLTSG